MSKQEETRWKSHKLNKAELKRLHEGYEQMLESFAIAELNKPPRRPLPNVIINGVL